MTWLHQRFGLLSGLVEACKIDATFGSKCRFRDSANVDKNLNVHKRDIFECTAYK